uniref:Uncharacterized protein n=1 Tax=Phasianus colchicus TaxID=9054 RepID=A0A669P8H9_PHACC
MTDDSTPQIGVVRPRLCAHAGTDGPSGTTCVLVQVLHWMGQFLHSCMYWSGDVGAQLLQGQMQWSLLSPLGQQLATLSPAVTAFTQECYLIHNIRLNPLHMHQCLRSMDQKNLCQKLSHNQI